MIGWLLLLMLLVGIDEGFKFLLIVKVMLVFVIFNIC